MARITSFKTVLSVFLDYIFFTELQLNEVFKLWNIDRELKNLELEHDLQLDEKAEVVNQQRASLESDRERQNVAVQDAVSRVGEDGALFRNLSDKMKEFVRASEHDDEFPIDSTTKLYAFKMLREKFHFKIPGVINYKNDGIVLRLQEHLKVEGVQSRAPKPPRSEVESEGKLEPEGEEGEERKRVEPLRSEAPPRLVAPSRRRRRSFLDGAGPSGQRGRFLGLGPSNAGPSSLGPSSAGPSSYKCSPAATPTLPSGDFWTSRRFEEGLPSLSSFAAVDFWSSDDDEEEGWLSSLFKEDVDEAAAMPSAVTDSSAAAMPSAVTDSSAAAMPSAITDSSAAVLPSADSSASERQVVDNP